MSMTPPETTDPVQPATRPPSGVAETLAPWLVLMSAVLLVAVAVLAVQVHGLREQVGQAPFNTATVDSGTDPADVQDLCRLLGALAKRQGVSVGKVLDEPVGVSACAGAAMDAAR